MTDEEAATALLAGERKGDGTVHTGLIGPLMNDPSQRERYARICGLAASLTEDPATKADLLLGQAYGLRYRTGQWEPKEVVDLLEVTIPIQIGQVTDEVIHVALELRRMYHAALVMREVASADHFLTAALLHEEAARLAPTTIGRLESLVMASVERMHHGVEINDLKMVLDGMIALDPICKELHPLANAGDIKATKLILADSTSHRLYCQWLMGERGCRQLDTGVTIMQSLPEPLVTQYSHWPAVFAAASACERGAYNEAIAMAEKVLIEGRYPASDCVALLVIARSQEAWGSAVDAQQTLQKIIDYPSHGAHFVRAVARRELAAL